MADNRNVVVVIALLSFWPNLGWEGVVKKAWLNQNFFVVLVQNEL